MKRTITFLSLFFALAISGFSQSYNLVIFSEDGDPFFAFVNGIRQNDKPETNIRVTGLNAESLSLRVEFENAALPKLKQNMMGENGYEHTVRIKKNVKKEMKLQYFGKVALNEAPKSSGTSVAYHTAENPVNNSTSSSNSTVDHSRDNNSTVINENGQTVISSSTSEMVDPSNVSVNINVGETGMNVNMSGMNGNSSTVRSTTSTTVTQTTSSSGNLRTTTSNSSNGQAVNHAETVAPPKSAGGCSSAMTNSSFEKMKQSIESKPFSDTKMSTAKLATKNSCLSVDQVKEICKLFSMDEDKLTYAKYARDFCVNKTEYYHVSEVFSFSTTTDEFNEFLENK